MAARKHGWLFRMAARARAASTLGALTCALLASPVAANGRFPRAQRLIQDQANPALMALYGTYGVLVTRDGGVSWRHVCEGVTGAYAGEDPLLEIMADERLILRTDSGLSRSDASFCSYEAVLGSPSDALQDITRDSAGADAILAITTALDGDGVFVSSLSSSTDGGETFTPLGRVPPEVLSLGLTLDVAPSQPDLIYLSGLDEQGRGILAKSTDRGESFVGAPISGLGVAAPPYIAAVSALDADRVFIRTDVFTRANDDFEAREMANDSLYFTPDGGQTWHLALNARGKLYGFALSPDERWVLAGYGDPVLPAIFVEPDELGLYRVALDDLVASPDAPPWERIYDRGVTCLRWTENGLFACVAQDESGFEVGRANDANFSLADAAPFEPLLRLPEVRPLECPVSSPGAACLLDDVTGWQTTCGVLRAQCSLDAENGSSGAPGQPSGVAGGATGRSTDAPGDTAAAGMGGRSSSTAGAEGAAAAGEDSGTGGAAPSGENAARRGSSSCSMVGAPRKTSTGAVSAGWPFALLLLAARRCRRPRRAGALLVALLQLGASSLTACSDEATPDGESSSAGEVGGPGADVDALACGGAGEDFALGMSKSTPDGDLTVAVVAAEPAPPLVGANAWRVQLSDGNGEALTAANVSFAGWMPQHGHGLNAVPLIHELDGGRYEIEPIILYMPQLWELSIVVARDDERDVVTFDVCVP